MPKTKLRMLIEAGQIIKDFSEFEIDPNTLRVDWLTLPLNKYLRRNWHSMQRGSVQWSQEMRAALSEMQNNKCCICGCEMAISESDPIYQGNHADNFATFEHVRPMRQQGLDGLDNIVITCRACNTTRPDYDHLVQFGTWREDTNDN